MYNFLIEERNRRRKSALHTHHSELLQSHSKPDLFPSRETFLSFPPVEALWKETTSPLPESIDVTGYALFDAEKWSAALPSIQAAVLQYQGEVETLAIARLTARGLPVPPATEILDDPQSIFCYVPPVPPGEADIVFPFPAIHAKMRDRQDGRGFRSSCAAEFMSVQEGKVVGGNGGLEYASCGVEIVGLRRRGARFSADCVTDVDCTVLHKFSDVRILLGRLSILA